MNNRFNIIKNVEKSIYSVPSEKKDSVRNITIEELITEKNSKQEHAKHEERLLKQHVQETKKYAQEYNVLLTNADKGNVTVSLTEMITTEKSCLCYQMPMFTIK